MVYRPVSQVLWLRIKKYLSRNGGSLNERAETNKGKSDSKKNGSFITKDDLKTHLEQVKQTIIQTFDEQEI